MVQAVQTPIEEIKSLGCESVSDATLCAYTYLELLRRHNGQHDKVYEVSYHYNVELKKCYCQARNSETGPLRVYIPISSCGAIKYDTWDEYFALLTEIHQPNIIIIVMWEADGTFVSYELTKGLGSPPKGKSQKSTREKASEKVLPSTSEDV